MSSLTVKGILSFPNLFTAKKAKGSDEPKFGVSVMLAPGDPQIAKVQEIISQAKAGVPGGYAGVDECFGTYESKYQGKEYYDPRFNGYYVLSSSAKETDRPEVVDANFNKIVDPAKVIPGMVGHVHLGISYYSKGKTGIGGWLNGVMLTDEEPPMGRLDNKPSIEAMFGNVNNAAGAAQVQETATTTTASAPPPPPNAQDAPPPPPPEKIMTAAANGATYESYIEAGWTDQQMIDNGLLTPPTSF